MLSWEFPPRIIGGIASHVYDLSRAIVRKNLDVHVVTCGFPDTLPYDEVEGVQVYRFDPYEIPTLDFLSWVLSMNTGMAQRAGEVIDTYRKRFDLIHAHDWLVAKAALELKNQYGIPLVSTIHATEMGRRGGIQDNYHKLIHDIEHQLVHQSDRIICCSQYMAKEVSQNLNISMEKIDVIYNGVDTSKFDLREDLKSFRERYASPNEKIILYVGRLVYEKGVHILIEAMPKILKAMSEARLIIVGEGRMKEFLENKAQQLHVADEVHFLGFVQDQTLRKLYHISDVAVFPSLYEPFGIGTLEAMAAKVPVVVSGVGGLGELVEHDKTGVKVYPDNSDSLVWGIMRVLRTPKYANMLKGNAYKKLLHDYNWDLLARKTLETYIKALLNARRETLQVSKTAMKLKITLPKQILHASNLLLVLHTSGATTEESSKALAEIANMRGVSPQFVSGLLNKLVNDGYVTNCRDQSGMLRYYLTKIGIIKACSLFT